MNDPIFNLYLRAKPHWQLFIPALFLIQALAVLYFDGINLSWSSHGGWER